MTTSKEQNGDSNGVATVRHSNSIMNGGGDIDTLEDGDPLDGDLMEEIVIRVDPLLQQHASPTDIDRGLRLIQICRDGDIQAVQQQVKEGAPAGFITKTGWTPLAAAAFGGKIEIVLYMLEIGADAMYKTSKRQTILSGENTFALANSNYPSAMRERPGQAGSNNYGSNTPLHWACYKGHVNVVSILLRAGYGVEDVDSVGNRCLHLACSGGHQEVIELLLANSAAVDQTNRYGNRSIDLATDMTCRKLLYKFQMQTACEWCKEPFSKLRRPSLCQHCHNVYCDAKPCSSTTETIHPTYGFVQSKRHCQECATEMGKAEQDLRGVLEARLEMIRQTLNLINTSSSNRAGTASSVASRSAGDSQTNTTDDVVSVSTNREGASEFLPTFSDGVLSAALEVNGRNMEGVEPPVPSPEEQSSIDTVNQDKPKRILTNDEISRVLMMSRTDAEALYTAIEAAKLKAADPELILQAKQTYQQLVAHVMLQEEIQSLMVLRPIGIRSLIEPLKRALQLAKRDQVPEPMLELATQVIQSAEVECTLFGCHALCERIERGTKKHRKDIARLETSINEAQMLGVNEKLLGAAIALRDRLNAEIMLEACLLPFTPKLATNESGNETTHYIFSDGTVIPTLLQALELRSQQITTAVEFGTSVMGVSTALLDEGASILKQLKKEIREETKNEEERRRLKEEAALKAAKKGKKKKA